MPTPARPRPYSVSGVFPSLAGLSLLLPALDGADRLVLVDLPRVLAARAADAGTAATPQAGSRAEAAALALAAHIRSATDARVEPRNIAGYWDVAARYRLLVEDAEQLLRLTPRGRRAAIDADAPGLGVVAVREGLAHLAAAVDAGATSLAALLPGWRAVLAGNPRFAAAPSHARSLGQRVAALVADGWLVASGEHATRLADEAGFRRREAEPAFAGLGGGLALTAAGRERLATCRRRGVPGASPGGGGEAS